MSNVYLVCRLSDEDYYITSDPIAACLTEQEANDHLAFLLEKDKVVSLIFNGLKEEAKRWKQNNPDPCKELPLKPKMKPGQSHPDHIKENIDPWKLSCKQINEENEETGRKWYNAFESFLICHFNSHYAAQINKYGFIYKDFNISPFYNSFEFSKYKITTVPLIAK
jgi:hypothetical protein